jgi:MFS family permease
MNRGVKMEHGKSNVKFYGWIMVALLFVVYFITGGFGQYGVAVVNGLMTKQTGISRSSLGLGMSLFALFQGFAAPLIAKSINSKGVKFTIVTGSICFAFVCLLMATVVKGVMAFAIVFGVLGGAALAVSSTVPIQASINYWFTKRRALAIGIVMISAGIGGFFISPMIVKFVGATGGSYKMGWYFIAGAFLLAALLVGLFAKNKPEDIGQVPDGRIVEDLPGEKKASRVFKTKKTYELKTILKNPTIWLITLTSCGFFFCYSMVNTHAIVHITDRHFTTATAAVAFGLMPFASIFGRIAVAAIGDYIEPRILWAIGVASYIVGLYSLMVASSYTHLVVYAIGMGLGWGINMVSFPAIIGNYYGSAAYPAVMGVIFPIKQVANGISPVMAGAIFDATKSYNIAFWIGIAVCICSLIAVMFIKPIEEDA